MPNIYFTQYLRPNGRKAAVMIDRPDTVVAKADHITRHGFFFTVEQLGDSNVSLTISDETRDYAIEICTNDPQVPVSIDKMILGFDVAEALKKRASGED